MLLGFLAAAAAAGSSPVTGMVGAVSIRMDPIEVSYLIGEVAEPAARSLAATLRADYMRYLAQLGCAEDAPAGRVAVSIQLHRDRETKAVRTGDPRPAHLVVGDGAPRRVHMVLPANGASPDTLALARAAVHAALQGVPRPAAGQADPVLDGVSLHLAGRFMGRDLDWWEKRLVDAGVALGPEELDDASRYARRSYLRAVPSAALAIRAKVASGGPAVLPALLRQPGWLRPEPADRSGRSLRPVTAGTAGLARAAGAPGALQKGIGLAHEGYGVVDGYGSAASRSEIARLHRSGVNAIALSPYAFMSGLSDPRIRFLRREAQPAGTENDWAVLDDLRAARSIGMTVMLKPQIWLRGSSWTGRVAMGSEAHWRDWFEDYREFLLHYALLAEAGEADLLVVGTELEGTTLAQEARWRSLIAMARSVYGGPLTYAANWGREFETLAFWDALDFAGLDCYYPLSDDPQATDQRLAEGAGDVARRIERVAERVKRKVILTEVGFPALKAAWAAPWDESSGQAADESDQHRSYEALLSALWGRPWLAGLYWWKWPTSPEASGTRGEPLFSPRGRAAERALARWYGGTPLPEAR